MREEVDDLWTHPADARCVTTNGVVKSDGRLVMGAGVAKQARDRYPGIDRHMGNWISVNGNTPCVVYTGHGPVVSFPTKHDWRQTSDVGLIRSSAAELVRLAEANGWQAIALTRPGCGLGGLRWEDVRPVLSEILDDRFVVLSK